MLKGLDVLVFDVQDAGARFYTYMATMGYAMEAAARKGIEFIVLDRPNPISAARVEGPLMDTDLSDLHRLFPAAGPPRHDHRGAGANVQRGESDGSQAERDPDAGLTPRHVV